MNKTVFLDKNILFLMPTDKCQYRGFNCEYIEDKFKSLHVLNFEGYGNINGIDALENHILELIENKAVDVVITFPYATEHQLSVEYYKKLSRKAKIVFWVWDDELYFNSYNKFYAQAADAVIVSNPIYGEKYKQMGVPSIVYFSSYTKENYHPVETEKDIDVSFLGDCTKSGRAEYIDFLRNNGIKVETFGKGSKNGFADWRDFSKIFSRSKINLNFTRIDKPNWINKHDTEVLSTRQHKGRPIEIALTKSFCLSEYAPALNEMFELEKEIDVFHTKEELLEKVRYYLKNSEVREKYAQNAYNKAINKYESAVYLKYVFSALDAVLYSGTIPGNSAKKISLSRDFMVNTINSLTFTMFVILRKGKTKHAIEVFPRLFQYGLTAFIHGFYGGIKRVLRNRFKKIF